MLKLTFKQYLESKEQLRNAITNTPVTTLEYEVIRYCSLPVLLEDTDTKELVGLKPKHSIVVEWEYPTPNNPQINSIKFIGCKVDESDSFKAFWSNTKMQKWLLQNTKELK